MRDAPITRDPETSADKRFAVSVAHSREDERSHRFAELDAQIRAEDERSRNRPQPKPKPRRQSNPLPLKLRDRVTRLAQELQREHGRLFIADPKLKLHAARWLRSQLPPWGKPGAHGYDDVTAAIDLRDRFRRGYTRLYYDEKPHQIGKRVWSHICRELIPDYAAMTRVEQRDARDLLRQRVRDRLRKQKRYARRKTLRTDSPPVSPTQLL